MESVSGQNKVINYAILIDGDEYLGIIRHLGWAHCFTANHLTDRSLTI